MVVPGPSEPEACWSPTAQRSVADTATTPKNRPGTPALAAVTVVQRLPSKCSTSGLSAKGIELPTSPTAHTLLGLSATTPERKLVLPGEVTAWTTDQELPFQCRVSVDGRVKLSFSPTAQTSFGPSAEMEWTKKSSVPARNGAATCCQLVPLKCSNSGRMSSEPKVTQPAAQMSVADSAEIEVRTPDSDSPEFVLTSGPCTTDQAVPLKCSSNGRVWSAFVLVFSPTAQTLLAAIAATPCSEYGPAGLLAVCHRVPFQCSIRAPDVP